MIVVCPSCRQRYRHDMPVETPPPVAHCSGCDERFELAPAKSPYLLSPVLTAPPSSIEIEIPGMDATTHYPGDMDPGTGVGTRGATPAGPETAGEAATPGAATGARPLLETLVALVPSAIGAGIAYYFAGRMSQDPITWAALGGAVGLLLGWASLLWITRGD